MYKKNKSFSLIKPIIFSLVFIVAFAFAFTSPFFSVDKSSANATVKIGKETIPNLYAYKNHKKNIQEFEKKLKEIPANREEYKKTKSAYKKYKAYYKKYKSLFKYKIATYSKPYGSSGKWLKSKKLINYLYFYDNSMKTNTGVHKYHYYKKLKIIPSGMYLKGNVFVSSFSDDKNYDMIAYLDKKKKKKLTSHAKTILARFGYRFVSNFQKAGGEAIYAFSENQMNKLLKISKTKKIKKTKIIKIYYKSIPYKK